MSAEKEPFAVEFRHETEMAILVFDGDEEIWLPKSQIEYDEDAYFGDTIEVLIPEWLALEKRMI